MNPVRFLVFLLWVFVCSISFACDDFYEHWQNGGALLGRPYKAPKLPYNVLIPKKEHIDAGYYHDKFVLEDRTGSGGGSSTGEVSEKTLVEYFQRYISGDGRPGYSGKTLVNRQLGAGCFQPPTRALGWADVGGTTPRFFYTVRNVSGMIFRTTPKAVCPSSVDQAGFEHLKSNHESGMVGDHNYFADASGEIPTVAANSEYCYFIFMPETADTDAFLGAVHQDDVRGKNYIKNGLVPYMDLKVDYLAKLADPKIFWVKNRYVLPAQDEKILFPRNGVNLLFSRYTSYRPYHVDRHLLTTGNSQTTLITLIGSIFPEISGLANPSIFRVEGVDGLNYGMKITSAYASDNFRAQSGGPKINWGAPCGGSSIYMAFEPHYDPDPATPKNWSCAMHFFEDDVEREYLNKVRDGAIDPDFDINPQFAPYTDGHVSHVDAYENDSEVVAWLERDDIIFQLYKGPVAPMISTTDVGTPGCNIPGYSDVPHPLLNDASLSPTINTACGEYHPFLTRLEQFYTDNGITSADVKRKMWDAPVTTAYGWSVSTLAKKIDDFFNDTSGTGGGALLAKIAAEESLPGVALYLSDTVEGRMLSELKGELLNALYWDDKKLADDYLSGLHDDFTTAIDAAFSACEGAFASCDSTDPSNSCTPTLMSCIVDGGVDTYETKIKSLHENRLQQGSLWYYLAHDADGNKLMTKLAAIHHLKDIPEDRHWGYACIPPSIVVDRGSGTCSTSPYPAGAIDCIESDFSPMPFPGGSYTGPIPPFIVGLLRDTNPPVLTGSGDPTIIPTGPRNDSKKNYDEYGYILGMTCPGPPMDTCGMSGF